jgi:hypothetical protein
LRIHAAKGDASNRLPADCGEGEAAVGRRIGAGQARELIAKVLEAGREAEGVPVFLH